MMIIGVAITVAAHQPFSILSHTAHWDGGWYMTVINGGYVTNAAAPAFYPLFPAAVSLVRFLSFSLIDVLAAGQIVNLVSLWLIVTAMLKIGQILFDDERRYWLPVLMLTGSTAFFLHVFYSEALFMALGFWAYLFALRSKWLKVGLLLAILTATRLPAVLFVVLCLLEYARQYKWNIKKIFNLNLAYFLLAPLGFITYAIFLQIVRSDFLAMFHAYKATNDWVYQVFNINFIGTIIAAFWKTTLIVFGLVKFNKETLIGTVLPVIALLLLSISSLYLTTRKDRRYLPLGIIGFLSIIMFTLNSNVISLHRYALPSLSIYVAAVLFFKQRRWLYLICAMGLVIQFYLYTLFISNIFAG